MRAAARAHHQAVDGRKSHRRGDAAPVLHGAQARAIAEMGDDDALVGEFGCDLAQPAADKLIGQAVEAVAPDAAHR